MADDWVMSTTTQKLVIVNPTDRAFTSSRFILWFGACGTTRLMIWADSLDSAFDEAVDWIAENAKGLLCNEQVEEEYSRSIGDGDTVEQAQELAEVDTSCGGNYGDYVLSYEWGIVVENPSREQILEIQGR